MSLTQKYDHFLPVRTIRYHSLNVKLHVSRNYDHLRIQFYDHILRLTKPNWLANTTNEATGQSLREPGLWAWPWPWPERWAWPWPIQARTGFSCCKHAADVLCASVIGTFTRNTYSLVITLCFEKPRSTCQSKIQGSGKLFKWWVKKSLHSYYIERDMKTIWPKAPLSFCRRSMLLIWIRHVCIVQNELG